MNNELKKVIQNTKYQILNTKTLLAILAVVFSLGLLTIHTAGPAYADQGHVGAYPSNYDPSNPKTKSWFIYELKPGESKNDSITVVNNSDAQITVKVYPVDATTTS